MISYSRIEEPEGADVCLNAAQRGEGCRPRPPLSLPFEKGATNPFFLYFAGSLKKLRESEKRLIRARIWRIWIEENPKINLFNYFFYRIRDRKLLKIKIGDAKK